MCVMMIFLLWLISYEMKNCQKRCRNLIGSQRHLHYVYMGSI